MMRSLSDYIVDDLAGHIDLFDQIAVELFAQLFPALCQDRILISVRRDLEQTLGLAVDLQRDRDDCLFHRVFIVSGPHLREDSILTAQALPHLLRHMRGKGRQHDRVIAQCLMIDTAVLSRDSGQLVGVFHETGDDRITVIASTASPFKFAPAVLSAIDDGKIPEDGFMVADKLSAVSGMAVPGPLATLKTKEVLHKNSIAKEAMADFIRKSLA